MSNERKVAVVTGASSGIGLATAVEFAKNGYDLVLAARDKDGLKTAATMCNECGAETYIVKTDTTSVEAVENLAMQAASRFDEIDVWVNDAATYMIGKFEDLPDDDMHQLMETNFFGYVYGSRAALTRFKEQGYGTLINISSINAVAPQPYVSVYSASKAAVRALSESLRMELKLDGLDKDIHVCTVMPASVDTNIYQNGANYMGQEVQAMEPVYDPEYVAKQIVKLAESPKRGEIMVGQAGRMMAMQNSHMPSMYERMMAKFTQKNLVSDDSAETTKGNLYKPDRMNEGMMRGGWGEERIRSDMLNAGLIVTAATVIGAGLLGWRLARAVAHHR